MATSKHEPGEYVDLHWEDFAEVLYVFGHVTPAEFVAVCAANHGPGVIPIPGEPSHRWGAWRFNGQDESGHPCRALRTYAECGRGMFPVTVADVVRWDVEADTENAGGWTAEDLARFAEKDATTAAYRNRWIAACAAAEPTEAEDRLELAIEAHLDARHQEQP